MVETTHVFVVLWDRTQNGRTNKFYTVHRSDASAHDYVFDYQCETIGPPPAGAPFDAPIPDFENYPIAAIPVSDMPELIVVLRERYPMVPDPLFGKTDKFYKANVKKRGDCEIIEPSGDRHVYDHHQLVRSSAVIQSKLLLG